MSNDNSQHVTNWPDTRVRGAKRANIAFVDEDDACPTWDWFAGHGKDESCQFEGTWWDMICFARNVLASENTRLVAPEFHRPDWRNDNYAGPAPYTFGPINKETDND